MGFPDSSKDAGAGTEPPADRVAVPRLQADAASSRAPGGGVSAAQYGRQSGLRRTCGLDVWDVAANLDIHYPPQWFDRICELEDAGWIEFDGRRLRLTPAGWLLANGVTEELLWPNLLSTSEATQ